MKFQNTFTFIISKNYGHPISWNMPAWRFYLGSVALLAVLAAMTVMTVMFLATYPRLQQIERERDDLERQRDALKEQIFSFNQEIFEFKEARLMGVGSDRKEPDGDFGSGVVFSDGEEGYQPPLVISSVTTKVDRRTVEVVFRIKRLSNSADNRGGFLFAIFENDDHDPVQFTASPPVAINEGGFPQTYKSGIRFSRIRDAVTFRRRIKRRNSDDYYTHVTLFLFSLRGGLLVRDRFRLDAEIFRKDANPVKIQELLRT